MKAKKITFKESLNREKCITFFIRYGYFVHTEDDQILVMRKAGSQLTVDGEKFPKELSIFFKSNETEIALKYNTFVLFDTGDLQEELDVISNRIKTNINSLV
ncbi:hypothetical protein [Flavimarina sp. Hel_I_48]|uniref:hypothetical protein n=1 Tax=Flavimarina sp. Hel_I_48 TaxID=1392488 RepID=UPI0004DFA114|nr:hypothetical protein [Flavimarina sp. Hel_I_48]